MIPFEVYATSPAPPAALWALVGDLRRLTEWTDAETIAGAPEPPLEVGQRFATSDRGRERGWVIITTAERLVEIKTDDTPCGRLGIGVRAAPDPLGSRLVLAGLLDAPPRGLRARTMHVPRLRARFDRWCSAAVSLAR
ncbi:MAG: hypothetical protein H0V93_03515 [Euzebyales bacterium]|nr:hypothetical protein [Euzebyales bacterium]